MLSKLSKEFLNAMIKEHNDLEKELDDLNESIKSVCILEETDETLKLLNYLSKRMGEVQSCLENVEQLVIKHLEIKHLENEICDIFEQFDDSWLKRKMIELLYKCNKSK